MAPELSQGQFKEIKFKIKIEGVMLERSKTNPMGVINNHLELSGLENEG